MMSADTRNLRVAALVLLIAYPLIHFVTRLEDPFGYEPLWQHQLLSLLFGGVVAASFSSAGRRYLVPLFHGALFLALGWGLWCAAHAGFAGKRSALITIIGSSGLLIRSRWLLAAYFALIPAGYGLGLALTESVLPPLVVLSRITVGVLFISVLAGVRFWTIDTIERSERKFRGIVQGAPLPFVILAKDCCLLVNDAAQRLFGLSPGDRLSERLLDEAPWWTSPTSQGTAPVRVRGADGVVRDCVLSFAPLYQEPDRLLVILVEKALLAA
jgi:PAS domain-containing protein